MKCRNHYYKMRRSNYDILPQLLSQKAIEIQINDNSAVQSQIIVIITMLIKCCYSISWNAP